MSQIQDDVLNVLRGPAAQDIIQRYALDAFHNESEYISVYAPSNYNVAPTTIVTVAMNTISVQRTSGGMIPNDNGIDLLKEGLYLVLTSWYIDAPTKITGSLVEIVVYYDNNTNSRFMDNTKAAGGDLYTRGGSSRILYNPPNRRTTLKVFNYHDAAGVTLVGAGGANVLQVLRFDDGKSRGRFDFQFAALAG